MELLGQFVCWWVNLFVGGISALLKHARFITIDTELLNQQAKCLTVDKVCFQSVYSRVAFRNVGFTGGVNVRERGAGRRTAVWAYTNS